MMIKTWVKQAKIQNVAAYFSVGDVETDIKPWLSGAGASQKGYMLGYNNLKAPYISGFFPLALQSLRRHDADEDCTDRFSITELKNVSIKALT